MLALQGQVYMGDRGVFTMWAGLMALACLMVLLAIEKGALWHEWEEEASGGAGQGSLSVCVGAGIAYSFKYCAVHVSIMWCVTLPSCDAELGHECVLENRWRWVSQWVRARARLHRNSRAPSAPRVVNAMFMCTCVQAFASSVWVSLCSLTAWE